MKLFSLKTVGWSAAIFLTSAISASAVSVSLIDGSVQGPGNRADEFASGFNGTTPAGATWSGAAPVVTPPPGSIFNRFESPFNNTSLQPTQTYFAVGGQVGDNGGPSPMTLTFDTPQSQLDLLWGSIDSYNTLTFLDGENVLTTFEGGDIIAAFPALAGDPDAQGNFEQVALLSFVSDDQESPFSAVRFTSDTAAFEFGLQVEPIPLPAAVWMLLTAMAGLGFVSSRRKSA